jgi:hypothetical protein
MAVALSKNTPEIELLCPLKKTLERSLPAVANCCSNSVLITISLSLHANLRQKRVARPPRTTNLISPVMTEQNTKLSQKAAIHRAPLHLARQQGFLINFCFYFAVETHEKQLPAFVWTLCAPNWNSIKAPHTFGVTLVKR